MAANIINIAVKELLIAVRDRLRSQLSLTENDCNIEHDEIAHPITGDRYLAVMPGGFQPGPVHGTSGGVADLVFAVKIMAVRRITAVPRDRTRDAFLLNAGSIEEVVGDVFQAIDWKYEVTNAAALAIWSATGTSVNTPVNFHHPLVFAGMDAEPKVVDGEMFAGKAETRAGLKKTIWFNNARFTAVKTA